MCNNGGTSGQIGASHFVHYCMHFDPSPIPLPFSDQEEHFTFVLTDLDSKYKFGFCRYPPKGETCMCFLRLVLCAYMCVCSVCGVCVVCVVYV